MQGNKYGSVSTTLARMVSFKGLIKAPKRITQASENQFRVLVSKKSERLYNNLLRRENEKPHAGQGAKEARPGSFQMNHVAKTHQNKQTKSTVTVLQIRTGLRI